MVWAVPWPYPINCAGGMLSSHERFHHLTEVLICTSICSSGDVYLYTYG